MGKNLSTLLTYPFDKKQINWPENSQDTLIWNAEFCPSLASFSKADWVQSFKPYALTSEKNGIKINPELSDKKYQSILCVLPKEKEKSLYMLACAVQAIKHDGVIITVAANDAGGKRLESWLTDLGLKPQSLSKSKSRISWVLIKTYDQRKVQQYISEGLQQEISANGYKFVTKPGIYGWNKIDAGSKILVSNVDKNLQGVGADFGCGYGYLSQSILEKKSDIKKLYVIEADYDALMCAQKNLGRYETSVNIEYMWEDLTKAVPGVANLDWVIMNPPFHKGKKTDSDIGREFIQTASASLKKGGALYMVANVHLPYEKALNAAFSNVQKIIEEQGFKVFKAIK